MGALQVAVVVLLLMCVLAVIWKWNHGGGGGDGPTPPTPPNSSGCYTTFTPSKPCPSDVGNAVITSTLGCCAAKVGNDPRFQILRGDPKVNPNVRTYSKTVNAYQLKQFGGDVPEFEAGSAKNPTRNFYINVPVGAQGKMPFLLLFDSGKDGTFWDYNMSHDDGHTPSGVSDVVRTVANSYPVVTMGPAWLDHWYNVDAETKGQQQTYDWKGAPQYPDTANTWNVGLYNGWGNKQDMPFIQYVVQTALSNPDFHCSPYCLFIAFSAGTAMASRAIQEWPKINKPYKMPQIIGAVLNDGASYQCYAYPVNSDPPPDAFKPCLNSQNGCCPSGFSELDYRDDAKNHPPTLVQSPQQDANADSLAASKYYDSLKDIQGRVMYLQQPLSDIHGLDPTYAPIEIRFILELLDIYKNRS